MFRPFIHKKKLENKSFAENLDVRLRHKYHHHRCALLMGRARSSISVKPLRSTPCAPPTSRGPRVITAEQARSIFVARQKIPARNLAARLALQHKISSKAIRDIWSLRTWTHVTKPHWTRADQDRFERKKDQQPDAERGKPWESMVSEEAFETSAGREGRQNQVAARRQDKAQERQDCSDASEASTAGSERALEQTVLGEAGGECTGGDDGPDSDWSEDAFACFEKAVADFDGDLYELGSQPFAAGYDPVPRLDAYHHSKST